MSYRKGHAAGPELCIFKVWLLEPLIDWLFWVEYTRSTRSVTSCDCFLLRGACDPFLPRPAGIPCTATSEKFGFFLDFEKHATNSSSCWFISATATLCEHIPKDLKFTQPVTFELTAFAW